jgi:hypothetical protein
MLPKQQSTIRGGSTVTGDNPLKNVKNNYAKRKHFGKTHVGPSSNS